MRRIPIFFQIKKKLFFHFLLPQRRATSSKQREMSDDEFESADEGESISTSNKKSTAVTEGWDDWNTAEFSRPIFTQQESLSSISSSSLSKTEGTSQLGSDEDESVDSSDQQSLQRKKLRRKSQEAHWIRDEPKTNARTSRPVERHIDDASKTTRKHHVNETHHLLDRLAAQSPTRTVTNELNTHRRRNWSNFRSFSRVGHRHGAISARFYPQQSKAFQH